MKRIKSFLLIAIVGLVVGSCKKDFLDVNTNPNTITGQAGPGFVFTGALNQTVTNMVDQNETGSYYAGHWTQSSSYIYTATTFAYQFTNSNFNYWDPIYNNLQDYEYVIQNAEAKGQPFYKGPAQVMKAMLFQQLVDLYGNVPYTEALKGTAILTPKFDDQKAIYESLILLLDSAVTNIKAHAPAGTQGSADIAFNGSTSRWLKFANSLRMRILMRQSRVAGRDAYIIAEIKKAVANGGGFLGAGEDVAVNPGYLASAGKQNPFYDRWGYDPAGGVRSLGRYPRPTKYVFDVLINNNDTFRLKRIAYTIGGESSTAPGVSSRAEIVANYRGVPFGSPSGYTAPSTSYIGPAFITRGQYNKPLYLMLAAESQFLLAEAAQRYGTQLGLPNTAQQYYERGVREAFRVVGASDAQATVLLGSGKAEADWAASPDKLKAIWMQKWLSMFGFQGLEAWSEVRRTNYPPIPVSAGAAAGAKPPVRLFYPLSELGSNGANVLAQGDVDVFNGRLFWDVD